MDLNNKKNNIIDKCNQPKKEWLHSECVDIETSKEKDVASTKWKGTAAVEYVHFNVNREEKFTIHRS